jgi:DNA helicase-2/ATP-dependent DNA helicase PcrA
LVGAQRFYGRREIKDIIAYLRLVQNPDDEISLTRVINVPGRGIGDKSQEGLQLTALQAHTSPGQVLLSLGQNGDTSPDWPSFKGRGAALFADFGSLLAEWVKLRDTVPLPALFDRILTDVSYQQYIEDMEEEKGPNGENERWENVQELRRLAYEYDERGLVAFLETLALVSDQDTLPEQADAPTLLTLHAAKGLEFPQVFIVGLDEGLLPHSRSRDDPEQMAEERRLFYVGITRAKDRLYLVRAERRSTYGSFEDSIPSRFVDDLPPALLQRMGVHTGSRSRGGARYSADDYTWSTRAANTQRGYPPPQTSAPIIEPRYTAGCRVNHPSWGEGLVISTRIQDGDEIVDVIFESVGLKRLAASLAKLDIVKPAR